MATIEQMQRKQERVDHFCNLISANKLAGLLELSDAAVNSKTTKITRAVVTDVLALSFARGVLNADDIPAAYAMEVLEKYLKGSGDRKRDTAADRGNDVHDIAERLANGELVSVPEDLAGHIQSFNNFRRDYGLRFLLTEFTVFNFDYGYAGTGDFLATSDVYPEMGVILGDYKTSESGIWPDIALQLAALRYGTFIGRCLTSAEFHTDHEGHELLKDYDTLGSIKSYMGVQITGSGYQAVPVNVSERTFDVFRAALIVSDWKTNGEKWALEPAVKVPNNKESE